MLLLYLVVTNPEQREGGEAGRNRKQRHRRAVWKNCHRQTGQSVKGRDGSELAAPKYATLQD